MDKVPVALTNLSQTVVSSRLIFEHTNTSHCEELIYPKEFMADTIPPVITDIPVISLANNSANVTWITDEFADSVLKYCVNSAVNLTLFYIFKQPFVQLNHSKCILLAIVQKVPF